MLGASAPAAGQTQTIEAARFRLTTGPCVLRSGAGSPEGALAGNPCDTYWRTDQAQLWRKVSGTGTTGWELSPRTGASQTWIATNDFAGLFRATGGVESHLIPSSTDTYDLGSSTKLWNQGYLSQLNATLFAKQVAQLFGGWAIIGTNAGTFAASVGSSDTTADFGQSMASTHFVVIRATDESGSPKTEYLQVGSLVSGTRYNVTRDLAGAHGTDPAWPSGTPWLLLGYSGHGRIELNAYDTPRISLLTQGTSYNSQLEYIRVGDLNGNWGYSSPLSYGIAVGAYTGSQPNWTIDTTNGFRLRNYATNLLTIDTSGNASFAGVFKIGSNGGIYQGSGTFASPTTGLKIWNDAGTGRIGGYSAGTIQWYANTDGKLYAGGGSTKIDAAGITVSSGPTYEAWPSIPGLKFTGDDPYETGYEFGLAGTSVTTTGRKQLLIHNTGNKAGSDTRSEIVLKAAAEDYHDYPTSIKFRLSAHDYYNTSSFAELSGTSFGLAGSTTNAGVGLWLTQGTINHASVINPALKTTATWSSSGATGILWDANVTDTASAAGSAFLRLQLGGSSKYVVRKDGAILERGRATPQGEWQTRAFAAGNYTGCGSMTWTVDAGDVGGEAWTLIGKTLHFTAEIGLSGANGTDIGGTADYCVRIAIPGSHTAARRAFGGGSIYNGAGWTGAIAEVSASGTTIDIYRSPPGTWTLDAGDATRVRIYFTFEVQ